MSKKTDQHKRAPVAPQPPCLRDYWVASTREKDAILSGVQGEPRLAGLLAASKAARAAGQQQAGPAWGDGHD